jgi:uncharacterized protein (TIGR03435 family)
MPGGRFEATNVPLRHLIRFAYGIVNLNEIEGGPVWMDRTAFDIVAKGEADASPELMLRSLLANRFRLVMRQETQERPAYELIVARSDGRLGPSLTRSAADCAVAGSCYRRSLPARFEQRGQPMAQVARTLTALLDTLVVDRTGLAGLYDAVVTFSPDQLPGRLPGVPPASGASDLPSIFTAIQEQLGLRLVAARRPVPVSIVVSAEIPTED